MSRPIVDYRWVAAPMRLIEHWYGPFWEPARPRPPASAQAILSAAATLEELLLRLAAGRRRSFAWAVVIGGIFSGLLRATLGRPAAGGISVATVEWLVIWPVAFATLWGGTWSRFGAAWATAPFVPIRPAPSVAELLPVIRGLTDAFLGADKSAAVTALHQIERLAPLTYQVCRRRTLVQDSVRQADAEAHSRRAHRTSAST